MGVGTADARPRESPLETVLPQNDRQRCLFPFSCGAVTRMETFSPKKAEAFTGHPVIPRAETLSQQVVPFLGGRSVGEWEIWGRPLSKREMREETLGATQRILGEKDEADKRWGG